jgi:negative regulator of sigma E activity
MKHNEHKKESAQDRSQNLLDREALSALMDNELSDFELRRLLRQMEQQPELLAEWERFALLRAALQAEPLRSPSSPDFANRVMAGIDQCIIQHGPLASSTSASAAALTPRAGWARNSTRFAVAASVTFAVFMGMQAVLQGPGPGDSLPALASGGSDGNLMPQNQQIAVDADAQQRLNDYIRSVTIPARVASQSAPYNILLDSPQLRPVSDRELLEEVEREPQQP